jgi:hypothetical protein
VVSLKPKRDRSIPLDRVLFGFRDAPLVSCSVSSLHRPGSADPEPGFHTGAGDKEPITTADRLRRRLSSNVSAVKETTSRLLVAAQALAICLPLTGLFLFAFLPSSFYFIIHPPPVPPGLSSAAASVVILATLLCAWRLLLTFIFRGAAALQSLSVVWWVLPFIAAALGIFVVAFVLTASVIEPSGINAFGWGLPLLLPLLHLRLEHQLRERR